MPKVFTNVPKGDTSRGQLGPDGVVTFAQRGRLYEASPSGTTRSLFRLNHDYSMSEVVYADGAMGLFDDYGTAYVLPRGEKKMTAIEPPPSLAWSNIAVSETGQTLSLAFSGSAEVFRHGEREAFSVPRRAEYGNLFVSDHSMVIITEDEVFAWNLSGGAAKRWDPMRPRTRMPVYALRPSSGETPLIAVPHEPEGDRDPIEVWNAATGKVVDKIDFAFASSEYADMRSDVTSSAVDASGKLVVAGSSAGEIALWNRSSHDVARVRVTASDNKIDFLAVDPDLDFVYVETGSASFEDKKYYSHRFIVPIENAQRFAPNE